MRDLEAFVQGQDIVYKNLVILISLFLILAFGLYISYILHEKKNYPIYLSENVFNDYVEKSNLNVPTTKSVIDNVTVATVKNLENISTTSYCPKDQCAVDLETGVKICPANIDSNTSNGADATGIAYEPGKQICVESSSCPPTLPYAIKNTGEAIDQFCSPGENCYCSSTPQCATRVVKYFQNTAIGNPGGTTENTFGYNFNVTGEKPDNNILNNIPLNKDDINNTQYCKLNPAFSDHIVDGCDFTNSWNEPTGCQYTNTLKTFDTSANYNFKTLDYDTVISSFNDLASINIDLSYDTYPVGSKFIGVRQDTSDTVLKNRELQSFFGKAGSFTINGDTTTYYYNDTEFNQNIVLLKDIFHGDNIPGIPNPIQYNKVLDFQGFYVENCLGGTNDNVNYKNMLNCVQTDKQPCTEGVLAYNIDLGDPRKFCLGTGVSLVLGPNTPIEDYFLINPAFFTLSCVIGAGCDSTIDEALCTKSTDCTNAFTEKNSKLFPSVDYSALTNNFLVQPSSFGLSFVPAITNSSGLYTISNNYIPLENGDYWLATDSGQTVTLASNGISGNNFLTVNNSVGLSGGVSITLSQTFKVNSVNGTSVILNNTLNSNDAAIAQTGYEVIFYGTNNLYGRVENVKSFANSQTFNLLDLVNSKNSNIDTANKSITFYKQFGFNGLNYNTVYDPVKTSRAFSDDYYYKVLNTNPNIDVSPPFTIYELLGNSKLNGKLNGILNSNANFKQTYSMYYPVFNQNTFRQECVYCSPSLHLDTLIDDKTGGVSGINIQFSGKDYYHYGFGNIGGIGNYNYISFGLTAINKDKASDLSNTNTIVLDTALDNIKVGDYVIDEDGFFNKALVEENTVRIYEGSVISPDLDTSSVLPDDRFLSYKLNNRAFEANNGVSFKIFNQTSSGVPNVFYGKTFYGYKEDIVNPAQRYYVTPTARIVSISSDGKTITTDSPNIIPLKEKKIIQFISHDQFLEVDVVQDPQNVLKAPGRNSKVAIESITQGRIVSLKIINQGEGYNSQNKPLIYVSKYAPSDSLFSISR